MYDQELTGFFKRHNIEYAPLDEESHKSYSSMKGFPFKGSRIAWSKIKNHRCRRLHETLEFVEEIEVILQPTDFCRLVRWVSLTLSGDKLLLENQDELGYRLVGFHGEKFNI